MSTLSPSLSEWLTSLGLQRLQTSFEGVGVKSPQDLSWLNDNDLEVILKDPMERLKIKIAIRQLEISKPREAVVITPEEDRVMKQLNDTATRAQCILNNVQDTVKATHASSKKAKTDIDTTFKRIVEAASRRKQELVDLLEKETTSKIDALNKQSIHISNILSQCSQAERESNKLLKTIADVHQLAKRENNVRKALRNVLNAKIDTEPVTDPDIMFLSEVKQLLKMVSDLGDIVSGAVPNAPNITELRADRNTVKVNWEPEIPNLEPGGGNLQKCGKILRYCAKISDHEAKCAEGEVTWEKEAVCEAKQQTHTFQDLEHDHQYGLQIKAMNDVNKTWGKFGKIKTVKTHKQRQNTQPKAHVWDTNKKANGLEIVGNQLTRIGCDGYQMRSCLSKTVYIDGKHSFETKIIRSLNKWALIGIAPQNTEIKLTGNCHIGHKDYPRSYGYHCPDGYVYHNSIASPCGTRIPNTSGDVIRVTVDIDHKTLQFSLNGKAFPQANIDITGPICPAVTLYDSGDKVGIIN